jgi:hypothetical protein
MPYIKKEFREDARRRPRDPGELNFAITSIIDEFLTGCGLSYNALNAAVGVLECAKLELYRRLAAPYEEIKKAQNGDVYKTQVPGYVRLCTKPPQNGC